MNKYAKVCQGFVHNYLGRPWAAGDGLIEKDVKKAEARLGIKLPTALRTFYLSVGRVADLCSIHNYILPPKDLEFEDGYLIFMDENQSVVSWGIKKKDLKKPIRKYGSATIHSINGIRKRKASSNYLHRCLIGTNN